MSLLAEIDELYLLERFSTYSKLKRVKRWLLWFINSYCKRDNDSIRSSITLTASGRQKAAQDWIQKIQHQLYVEGNATM